MNNMNPKIMSEYLSFKTKNICVIRDSGEIDTNIYNKIYTKLEHNLEDKKLLESRLQSFSIQYRLYKVVIEIQRQIEAKNILKNSDLNQDILQEDLQQMAQILNQNKRQQLHQMQKKKQRYINGTKRMKQTEPDIQFRIAEPTIFLPNIYDDRILSELRSSVISITYSSLSDFNTITIIIRRHYEKTKIYRSYDFYTKSSRYLKQTCIDNLQFNRFLQVLIDELQYDKETDILFYNLDTDEKIHVLNEHAGGAAMWNIYTKRRDDLIFGLDRDTDLDSECISASLQQN